MSVGGIHGTRLLPSTNEKQFFNSQNGNTDEYVFVFDQQDEYREPRGVHPGLLPYASDFVNKERTTFASVASGVGKLMSLVSVAENDGSMGNHYWSLGTAFFVAPKLLVCTRHNFLPTGYHTKACFFTTRFNFAHTDLENWLIRFKLPLSAAEPSPDCLAELNRRGVWLAREIVRQQDTNIPYQDLVDKVHTRNWEPACDYVFLSTDCASPMWFLPSGNIPPETPIALVANSSPYLAHDVECLCKFTRLPCPLTIERHHVCHIYKMPAFVRETNRKIISPGAIFTTASNNDLLAHKANSAMSSSGGPIVPLLSGMPNCVPYLFYGVHLGTFNGVDERWNYAMSVRFKPFLLEWYAVVFPRLESEIPAFSPLHKSTLKEYLLQVIEIVDEKQRNTLTEKIGQL